MRNLMSLSGKAESKRSVFFRIMLAIGISLVVSVLFSWVALFRQIELNILDFRFRHRPPLVISDRLGTVDIDSQTINLAGGWPISRKVYAEIVRCLGRYDVSLITFDLFFPDPGAVSVSPDQMQQLADRAGDDGKKRDLHDLLAEFAKSPDEYLAKALSSAATVLAQTFSFKTPALFPDIKAIDRLTRTRLENMKNAAKASLALADRYSVPYAPATKPEIGLARAFAVEPPIPELVKQAEGVGFAQMVQDIDGSARKYPMFIVFNGRLYPSIGLMGISLLADVPLSAMKIFPGSHILLPEARLPDGEGTAAPVDIRVPVDHYLRMMVNWTGDYLDTFTHIPASAVLKFRAEDMLRESIHAYAGRPDALMGRGYDEAVQRVVSRRLLGEAETCLMGMQLMIAQFAETAQAAGRVSKSDFLQEFASDDSEMRDMIAGVWNQVADNASILNLLRKDPALSYQAIKKKLAIADPRDAEMQHATAFLRFIVKRNKDPDQWRPLFFFTPIEISYEGSTRKTALSPLNLADKILYLGLTASGTHDYGPMPFNTGYPMVGLHVNAVNTIITRQFIHRSPLWLIFLITLGCAVPVAFLVHRMHPFAGAAFILLLGGGYFWGGGFFFNRAGMWLPTMQPIITVAMTFFTIVTYNIMHERREKRKLRSAFSTYVTPSIVKQVMNDPGLLRLGGERRIMTAFFSDVAGFTAISEQSRPEELVGMLNDYLDAMTGIIFQHEGTLDKYQGDGIMAFWNAPVEQADHAYRACCAAVDSIDCIKNELHPRWQAEGKPLFSIRIGVNTGAMIVGNMGSHARMDYTIMGDSVNLASRLESANKVYETRVMISEFVEVHVRGRMVVRELDIIRVLGKAAPVRVYEVIAREGEVDKETRRLINIYNSGLALYRAGEYRAAIDAFAEAVTLHEDDGPSKMYLRRCRAFVANPPEIGWDGVWRLKDK